MGIQDAKQAAAAPPAGGAPTAVATAGEPQDVSQPDAPTPNYYCQGKDHAARLVTVERFFHWAGEKYPAGHPQAGQLVMADQGPGLPAVPITSTCPVCPVCTAKGAVIDPLTGLPREARVSAIALEYNEKGEPVIPAAIRSLAARIGEA